MCWAEGKIKTNQGDAGRTEDGREPNEIQKEPILQEQKTEDYIKIGYEIDGNGTEFINEMDSMIIFSSESLTNREIKTVHQIDIEILQPKIEASESWKATNRETNKRWWRKVSNDNYI